MGCDEAPGALEGWAPLGWVGGAPQAKPPEAGVDVAGVEDAPPAVGPKANFKGAGATAGLLNVASVGAEVAGGTGLLKEVGKPDIG